LISGYKDIIIVVSYVEIWFFNFQRISWFHFFQKSSQCSSIKIILFIVYFYNTLKSPLFFRIWDRGVISDYCLPFFRTFNWNFDFKLKTFAWIKNHHVILFVIFKSKNVRIRAINLFIFECNRNPILIILVYIYRPNYLTLVCRVFWYIFAFKFWSFIFAMTISLILVINKYKLFHFLNLEFIILCLIF
jgi:hypothetical protein